MIGEQKAKALFAGGIALFVTGLVVLMLFVIPAAQHSQMAMAQGEPPMEAMPPEPGAPGGGGPMPGGPPPVEEPGLMGEMPPGMEGGIPGGMPGAGAAPAGGGAAAGTVITGAEPLEPSRPNPFAPRAAAAIAEAVAVSATTYGPDWSKLPIAERVAFVTPEIPPAPTPPLPPLQAPPESQIRITSILWDASGQAQAAYEDPEGKTGVLRPGDRINGFTVTQITRSGVLLENLRTGETQQLELRPRAKRQEEERPRRRPGARRRPQEGGRQRPTTGRVRPEVPGAPR